MSGRFKDGGQEDVQDYFDARFGSVLSPVMLAIEQEVTGTDVGATSWSSPAQVDEMIALLEIEPGSLHLDVGSGSGWPALRIAEKTEGRVVMTDLPISGLLNGMMRAERDGIDIHSVQASGSDMPFRSASVGSISHSDVLCCLAEKDAALEECARVLSRKGRMVFTVICLAESASGDDLVRLGTRNELIESNESYPAMLSKAGFEFDFSNLTDGFHEAAQKVVEVRTKHYDGLVELFSKDEADEIIDRSRGNLRCVEEGVLERHLYVCRPTG